MTIVILSDSEGSGPRICCPPSLRGLRIAAKPVPAKAGMAISYFLWDFVLWSFGFVSDLEFRISDFAAFVPHSLTPATAIPCLFLLSRLAERKVEMLVCRLFIPS